MTVHAQKPSIGRIVHYRSKTGDYTVPALVNTTAETLFRPGVDAGHVPDLTSDEHVHLTVFTPGKVGTSRSAEGAMLLARAPAAGGTYQEWDIPYDETGQQPGSWSWPPRV